MIATTAAFGINSCKLQSLCFHGDGEQTNSRGIAAWTVERRHGTGFHGVLPRDEHDRNRRSRGPGGCCRGASPDQDDHSYTAIHQLDRLLRQAIVLSLRPAVFDCNVATLDIAGLSEALLDCCGERCASTVKGLCWQPPPAAVLTRKGFPARWQTCRSRRRRRARLVPPHRFDGPLKPAQYQQRPDPP